MDRRRQPSDDPPTSDRFVVSCSARLVALMAVGSGLGLAVRNLHPEEPWAVGALRRNDLARPPGPVQPTNAPMASGHRKEKLA